MGCLMKKVKVAFVGLGGRGKGLLQLVLEHMPIAQVSAVCDL